ncbi:MAG: TAT-variant-translocated molybdopterin oxidoreductase [Phycisphaerales bacterium]
MSLDQCHSTTSGEKKRPGRAELAATPRSLQKACGVPVWRSVEELADTAEFRDFLEREFPAGASELERAGWDEGGSGGGESRRHFLKMMGASLALAGAATVPGCRRPEQKILPFGTHQAEEVIAGETMYYATSMPRPDGGAEGLLVQSVDGRPIKVEGNPLHPTNNGKCSSWALASVLGLYDPDRLKFPVYRNPVRGHVEATWDDFRSWHKKEFAKFEAAKGKGLALVIGKASSPLRETMVGAFKGHFPEARVVWYNAADDAAAVEGSRLAFGSPMRELLNFSKETAIVVSLDRDFLHKDAGELPNARGFAATRRVLNANDPMSRLYSIESTLTTTGGQADHRMALPPSQITAFAVEFAAYVLTKLGDNQAAVAGRAAGALAGSSLDPTVRRWMEACAEDVLDTVNRGKSLIVAGPSQPAAVHALAHAMNAALGNIGKSVSYAPMTEAEAYDSARGITELGAAMTAGQVSAVIVMDANPVFDAPADSGFAKAYERATSVCLSVGQSETAAASTWMLNGSHYLEAWGDARALDGTISPAQPLIAPLYGQSMSEVELLAMLVGMEAEGAKGKPAEGHELVRRSWMRATKAEGDAFDKSWKRALHDGVLVGSGKAGQTPKAAYDTIASAVSGLKLTPAPSTDAPEVVFRLGHVHDGRFAQAAWLHELPEVGTRTVWDNPALLSPATARGLGLSPLGYSEREPSMIYTKGTYPTARMAEFTVDGRTVTAAVWICPGMPDNTVALTLGYGREVSGRVADGVGFNFNPLRTSVAQWGGVRAERPKVASGTYMIASTQNHWTMEGRTAIVRAIDLPRWQKFADKIGHGGSTFYGKAADLKLGELLGDLSHTPPNQSIYDNPYNKSAGEPVAGSEFKTGQQWGMTIDQSSCTGCGACTIACQAENNIPVVGKKETAKGREMTWIRVDRYFGGANLDHPEHVYHQPVACVHCENAPCETVCPVNATVHGPEGINYMVYNRCIGTRYCANNCPYKVRRYNFFEYGKHTFNGDYVGKELLNEIVPETGGVNGSNRHNKINVNLIPPRLREKLAEIERMGKNPNVSVRMRGVMEKCSYCVQRINAARIECKLADLRGADGKHTVPEGFFQTACQQACPSDAIVFGDILKTDSRVSEMRSNARSYMLLGYLNTRPRTTHMVRVMNPNKALVSAERKAEWEVAPGSHGGGHQEHGPSEGHAAPAGGAHSFHGTPRSAGDKGYALSLKVLSGGKA